MNVLPLSLTIWLGHPLLATKRRKLLKKAGVCHEVQMDSSYNTACVDANPNLLHSSFTPDIERSGKVNTRECERWCLFDTEGWKWGWSWCTIRKPFMSPANVASMNNGPDETPSLENPILGTELRQSLSHHCEELGCELVAPTAL